MIVSAVGIGHVDVNIREQVAFTSAMKFAFQEQLYAQGITTCVIVSTCNRSEVYVVEETNAGNQVANCYRTFFHLEESIPIMIREGKEAIAHIFQVCAGLDSTLLGEDQIRKQVKDAYAFAQQSHCVNKAMHLLFQEAFHFAKTCKQTLRISEHPISSSYVVMKQIQQLPFTNANILLCGGGEVIQQCLPYIKDQSATLVIRSMEKGLQLQKQYPNITIRPFSDRFACLQACDILISATASPHLIFKRENVPQDNKIRYLFDMALPRDIDPAIADMSSYVVYDIDQIQKELAKHYAIRKDLAQKAQSLLEPSVSSCMEQLDHIEKEPMIAMMQQYLNGMAEDTYALLEDKLTLSLHDQRIMKKTLEYSYMRFLKDFTKMVKQHDTQALQILATWGMKDGEEHVH